MEGDEAGPATGAASFQKLSQQSPPRNGVPQKPFLRSEMALFTGSVYSLTSAGPRLS